ncbi:hypothetical protein AVM02_03975 [Brucella anthropi]|uniref:OmpA family protein n=1 Tax=Brucella anthropi TaxID=529 RepID=UPI00398780D9
MRGLAGIAALVLLASAGCAYAQAGDYKRDIRALKATVLSLKGLHPGLESSASSLRGRIDDLAARNSGLTVRQDAGSVRVSMTGDVLFDFDKAAIKPAAEPVLNEIARLVTSLGPDRTIIEGHTDSKGSAAYNRALSLRRAKAVALWLEAHGVDREKLSAIGLGSTRPVAPNNKADGQDNPEGRAQNRRVEFVLPKGK